MAMGYLAVLRNLRGIAVFLAYGPLKSNDAGHGISMPTGNIVYDCIPNAVGKRLFPQVCHASLFSHVERVQKRSPKAAQKGRKRKAPEPTGPWVLPLTKYLGLPKWCKLTSQLACRGSSTKLASFSYYPIKCSVLLTGIRQGTTQTPLFQYSSTADLLGGL